MISFRYHVVSLVAVFLALAVGIVVGTTALNGPVTHDLRNQVNGLKKDRTQLAGQAKTLQGEVDSATNFATAFGPQIVANSLKGQSVLVVVLPGVSSSMQDGLSSELTAAGATVSGKVVFTSAFLDPAQQTSITTIATDPSIHPAGWTAPATSDASLLAGSLLAYALTGKGQVTDTQTVLTAFSTLHMTSSDPAKVTASKNIVVLGTGTEPKGSYAEASELDLVQALASDGAHTVVAGDADSAESNGVIGQVRASTAKSLVSTVDNADTAVGQVSATLATAHAVNGQIGQYGSQKGAQALFPTPVS